MAQEDKSLLLRDLSARLPYGVKCNINGEDIDIGFVGITSEIFPIKTGIGFSLNEDIIKPYLRPMSNMTEEEKKDYELLCDYYMDDKEVKYYFNNIATIDWCYQKHFDCRGLIKLGLALEAPTGMYNLKEK